MLNKSIAFLTGVSCLFFLNNINAVIALTLLTLVIGLIAWLLFSQNNFFGLGFVKPSLNGRDLNGRDLNKKKLSSFKLLLFLAAGILWACANVFLWSSYRGNTISEPINTSIDGYICSIPRVKFDAYQFDFCITRLNQKELTFTQFKQVKLTWGKYSTQPVVPLKAGQFWQLGVKLKPPHSRYNPEGMDYQKWMLAQHYAGSGYVKNSQHLRQLYSFQSQYHQIRQLIYDKLNRLLPNQEVKGLLLALMMGERDAISPQQWEVLKHSGTSHLLAISGLHIGVAALWCYWLALFCWRLSARLCKQIPAQSVAEVASLIGGLSMLLLSGLGLPAQRAFIMLAVFVFSRWSGWHYHLFSTLGIALIIVLLWDPFAVLSASFWLSFLAVFVISLILGKQMQPPQKLSGWFKVNHFMFLAMLPLSLLFFNLFSMVSLIANLVLIPVASFVLIPLLYLSMLVMLVNDAIATSLYHLASQLMQIIYWFQSYLAEINQTYFNFSIAPMAIISMALIITLMLLPKFFVSRIIYLPLLLIIGLASGARQADKAFEMIVFDVGQGLLIYIQTPQGNLLFDTGWGNKDYALLSSTLIPVLEARGVTNINKLIISHGDSDHAGGLAQLYQKQKIDELISGESLDKFSSVSCHQYPAWQWGDNQFKFIKHLSKIDLVGNNSSCVLSITTPKGSILLTGDIEKKAEIALSLNGLEKHDIVVAPHHGSKTSSTYLFINAVMPTDIIFSTGYNNQWGFPKTKIVERYHLVGSKDWITHRDGAIIVSLETNESTLVVQSWRNEKPHFWLR